MRQEPARDHEPTPAGDLYRAIRVLTPGLELLSLSKAAAPVNRAFNPGLKAEVYVRQRFRLPGGFDLRKLAADPFANTGVTEPSFGVCTPRSGRFSTPHQ
jgi:hypothetical protein